MIPKIAVLDDDPDILNLVESVLTDAGEYEVSTYLSPMELLGVLERSSGPEDVSESLPTLILCDLKMPQMSGIEFVRRAKDYIPDTPIVFMTAHGSMESVIEAIRAGAFDYLLKPIDPDELKLAVEKALRFFRVSGENRLLRTELKKSWRFGEIIGKSEAIHKVFDLITRVAQTNASVLITGESGTGKELVARAIHEKSPRASGPFIAVNCSAIPENLLESELFGHGKGAFTGATFRKKGLFEEATGGTIFLDEIGDMPILLQSKILRVLQDWKIKPVGENKLIDIDVRVVAATHKNLAQAIKDGTFREDLYYRLSVLPIELPPLRNRREDIPLLAERFLEAFAAAHDKRITGFTQPAIRKIIDHHWPGNIRELKNTVERAVILTDSEKIDVDAIVFDQTAGRTAAEETLAAAALSLEGMVNFPDDIPLRELERNYIQHILAKHNGIKERAARILGIDRKTLYRKEREYDIVS